MSKEQRQEAASAIAERVGKAKVVVDGATIATYDLYPAADVPPAGFFGRAWDSLRLLFN